VLTVSVGPGEWEGTGDVGVPGGTAVEDGLMVGVVVGVGVGGRRTK
jgi:hypothetical protein